jgi:hypothetical protein
VLKKQEKVNMSDDLVKRIREWDEGCGEWELLEASADRIEKLEAALREIAALGYWDGDSAMSIARKALEGKDD